MPSQFNARFIKPPHAATTLKQPLARVMPCLGDRQMRIFRNTSTRRERVCRRIHLLAPRAGIFYLPLALWMASARAAVVVEAVVRTGWGGSACKPSVMCSQAAGVTGGSVVSGSVGSGSELPPPESMISRDC